MSFADDEAGYGFASNAPYEPPRIRDAEVLASRMQSTAAHLLILRDCCGIGTP
ncbi:MAG: hypothetical protein WCB02_20275 [Bradyrhizobium sp.]